MKTGGWRLAIVLAFVLATALAACSTTVVRTPGGSSAVPARRASVPKYGATAVVQRGDTLYGIAFRNGLDVRDLAAWNRIEPPYTIYPGQRLYLYPRGATAARPASATPARPPAARPSAPPPSGTTPARPVTPPPAASPPPANSGIVWRWPADGALIGRFAAGDPTRQGIDIAGQGGDAVRAAADGTVVYSGAGLVGYGELIIVKHNDNWLSAYGHNRRRLVNEGELVKAGQQIAEMGRSGAARDMLHFEIRYNGKPVDPLQHLPAKP
ncbi:MAG TPA: peptidoglycan DD-metalloendopeptidase family protein [Lysobacter sp.]|nr:peptidoglycan DD-metalloendopeptidase family protein [Lysobacter sp.]